MKKRLQGLVAGILIGLIAASGTAFAKTGSEMIEAIYSNIKIYIDGVKIDPKDATGNAVEPFIYNGTTYLSIRAVGEAIGKSVSWDGATQSVYLGEKPGEKQYLVEVCPPYDGIGHEVFSSSNGKQITVGGKKYTNAIALGSPNGTYHNQYALFNLDGKYKKLTFEVGLIDKSPRNDTVLNIYLDGELEKSYDLSAEDISKKITVNLNGALHLKIDNVANHPAYYGIFNAVLE